MQASTPPGMEVAWYGTSGESIVCTVQCVEEEEQCMEGGNFCRLLSTPEPWQELSVVLWIECWVETTGASVDGGGIGRVQCQQKPPGLTVKSGGVRLLPLQ